MESDIGITFIRGPGFDDERRDLIKGENIAINSPGCEYEEYVLKRAAEGAAPPPPEEPDESRLMGKLLDDFKRRIDRAAV